MTGLAPEEFRPETTFLNTASYGLPPARALDARRGVIEAWAAGRSTPGDHDGLVDEVRAGFARLLPGAAAADVSVQSGVAPALAAVVAALPTGAEVLTAAGEFGSLSAPFVHRGDLSVRFVPLERLVDEVRPTTALVAVSVVQSADGRVVDLDLLAAAARAHGARVLVDATQALGWLPLRFSSADYWVCGTFKWLLGARSVAFFAVAPEVRDELVPVAPGWYAAADKWSEMYAPARLADTARRFDTTPDWLGVVETAAGLSLIEELGPPAIGAHDLALAARFRAGLAELGYAPVPAESAIVAVPGAEAAAGRLYESGVIASPRAGNLRFSFHLYNTTGDVDRALETLAA
ncbi:MAG: aminotransferase class V-fold PLP-dependent enzyme [Mycobacteriaceae bacterium]|nr:aminotransferase class V-fold PLP-dependent enzyme [Mycobacteriaceae bacterium]